LSSDKDQAIEDFKGRISIYEEQYYPLDEELDKNLSFIKIFNQGERYLINNIHGMYAAVCLSLYTYSLFNYVLLKNLLQKSL